MARKPQVQARIPEDVKSEVDTYCDEHDLTQSDAVRRALERQYLDEGQADEDDEAEHLSEQYDDTNRINGSARQAGGQALLTLLAAAFGAWVGAGGAI